MWCACLRVVTRGCNVVCMSKGGDYAFIVLCGCSNDTENFFFCRRCEFKHEEH